MLEQLFQELNRIHFNGELPLPRLVWNPRLSSSAGRFCPGSRNPLRPRAPEIEVATYLRDIPEGEFHIRDTLLHEMVHYVLWHRGQPYGHNAEFHRILKKVGARRYNPVPKNRPVKYWYRCPGCEAHIPAKRLLKNSACAPCCKKFNGGFYSKEFRLELSTAPALPPKNQVIRREAACETAPTAAEKGAMAPSEIVRRLEEIKEMILGRSLPKRQ